MNALDDIFEQLDMENYEGDDTISISVERLKDVRQEFDRLQAGNARLRLVESAAKKLQSRLDEHFGGTDDWKEQAELRAALKGDVS